ncbi:MAG: hypothetical protein L0Z50_34660 [Verrucomicrobiales bacterium]|nr:hypothetical protein [Verrucomicrobiales bacterium]
MKNTIKAIFCVLMTATLSTAMLANSASAERELPFGGSLQGVLEIRDVQFPTLFAVGNDMGNATHLGRFAAAWEEEVNLISNAGLGSGQFVAANGDRLFYDFAGQSSPTGTPNQVTVMVIATITGGTGRFAGASGSFIEQLLADLGTGLTAGSFEGTIVFANKK